MYHDFWEVEASAAVLGKGKARLVERRRDLPALRWCGATRKSGWLRIRYSFQTRWSIVLDSTAPRREVRA
jgi:hypothetical protein